MKLPSFPRKALEADLDLFRGGKLGQVYLEILLFIVLNLADLFKVLDGILSVCILFKLSYKPSNHHHLQTLQSKILSKLLYLLFYVSNEIIHQDLKVLLVCSIAACCYHIFQNELPHSYSQSWTNTAVLVTLKRQIYNAFNFRTKGVCFSVFSF